MNRGEKRQYFKNHYRFFSEAWKNWNNQFPKRQPIVSDRNKYRIGYRRRNNLA